ncbi:MAG: SIS domain-containing protein [Bacillota bacterium]
MTREEQLAFLKEVIQKEAEHLARLADQVDEGYLEAARLLAECRGHVLVGGAGTSNAVAARLAHLLSCSGVPALFIHPADSLHGTSGAIRPEDTVIAISKGGETAEVVKFATIAKERGAKLIAFTERPDSPLGLMAHAVVRVRVAPDADPFGMIATTSSLANAIVGDAFCALLLKLKGYTLEEFARTHPGGAVGRKLAEMGFEGRRCGL